MRRTILKQALGSMVLFLAESMPWTRRLLKPAGLRTTQDLLCNRVISVRLPEGPKLRLTHADESYLAFQLFWRGADYYEPITRSLLAALVRAGDTFLDIGAHLGFFALCTSVSTPGVRVIAFEPNPKNFAFLKENAAVNGLADLVCEPIAISDRDGTGILYLTESDMSASLMKDFQAEDTKQIGSIQVPTASLDTYLGEQTLNGRLIIKVDIEGHEPAFFRGAVKTLESLQPDIILEVLYDQDPEVVSYLKSLGYHFYPITDAGLVELDAPRLVKRYPFLFLNHLLSVRPKEELARIFESVVATTRSINLLQTSKHFPKEEWPVLWQNEALQTPDETAHQR